MVEDTSIDRVDPQRRKERLNELIAKLRAGEDVAQRDLKNVLLDAEHRALTDAWEDQKKLRDSLVSKPAAVLTYEARLKKALFEYGKAEHYSESADTLPSSPHDGLKAHQRGYRKCETLLEGLIEYLEEQLAADPGLQVWFDRPLVFGWDGDITPSPSDMPRVVTSRSRERLGDGRLTGMLSKREVKLQALVAALHNIAEREAIEARITQELANEAEQQLTTRIASLRAPRRR
ncbi:hypothetical protein ACWA7J_06035 [Leptothrix sp. BB-4]